MVSPVLHLDYNSWKEIFRFQVVKAKDIHVGGARPHNHDFKDRAKFFAPDFSKVASKRHFWDMTRIGKRKLLDQGILMVKVVDAWKDGMLRERERKSTIRKRKGLKRQTDRQTDCQIFWRIKTETALVEQLNWVCNDVCDLSGPPLKYPPPPHTSSNTHTEWHPRDRWRIYLDQFKEVP